MPREKKTIDKKKSRVMNDDGEMFCEEEIIVSKKIALTSKYASSSRNTLTEITARVRFKFQDWQFAQIFRHISEKKDFVTPRSAFSSH